jgi:anti-sigma-K factor RskA
MSRELTHEEAFAALDAAALDALDASERDAVLWHAAGCSICGPELASLRDTAAMLAFSSPLAADTATRSRSRIRSKLIDRASQGRAPKENPLPNVRATDRGPSAAAPVPPAVSGMSGMSGMSGVIRDVPRHQRGQNTVPHVLFPAERKEVVLHERRFSWFRPEWTAIAATIVAVAAMAGLAITMRDRDNLQASLKEQATLSAQARTAGDSLRAALMSRDSLIAGLTGKDVAMMTLTATRSRAPVAHMFWDRAHNTWTLVAHNMPPLGAGRTYQLWLVTPKGKISAGTFASSAAGDAMMRATYPLPASDLRAIAVTEEPAGGAPQPTGEMVMSAQAR